MRTTAIHLSDVVCQYPQSANAVLKIEELIIDRGKLVFMLGSSGVGKSTLLETLGLMNNTIKKGSILFFPATMNDSSINFSELWKGVNSTSIEAVRKKYLSFIFQQTNLMENFTAYENLSLSKMIKEDASFIKSLESSRDYLNEIGLNSSILSESKMPNLLSGGQRQRLAFVRALNNQAEIVLCDEPTGNLDEYNAGEVMRILRESASKGKTIIVVSHDIDLALEYADEIVLLTKSSQGFGEVKHENIFYSKNWKNNPENLNILRNKIKSLFTSDVCSATVSVHNVNTKLTNIKYPDLFHKREFKSIAGMKFSNLFVLWLILTFTLLASGLGNGTFTYLKEKMNDPFVNLVDLIIPSYYGASSNKSKLLELFNELNAPRNKDSLSFESINPYYIDQLVFCLSVKDTANKNYNKYRTINIEKDSSFINTFILNPSNIVHGSNKGYKSNSDFRIIVTERFMLENELNVHSDYLHFLVNSYESDSSAGSSHPFKYTIPVGILAVVKELPEKRPVLIPERLHFVLKNDDPADNGVLLVSPFNMNNQFSLISYDTSESARATLMRDLTKNFSLISSPELIKTQVFGYKLCDKYLLDLNKEKYRIKSSLFESEWRKFFNLYGEKFKLLRQIDFSKNEYVSFDRRSMEVSKASVYFKNLNNVRQFDSLIRNTSADYGVGQTSETIISTDMTKIAEKETFVFLSTLSTLSSIVLLLFSVISISLFLYHLVTSHLSKIKMNIGTFVAIGLSNKEIQRIYFKIVFQFIFIALLLSLISTFAIGFGVNKLLSGIYPVNGDVRYFMLIHPFTAFLLIVILAVSLAISRITIRKSLSKTPGDLIYNR